MPWPLASHFSTMLQNPQVAFRDPQLKSCRIEKNDQNQPRPRSGAFAVVFRGFLAEGGERAVRVFTSESPERRERYEAIGRYLVSHNLRSLVTFTYDDRGVRSTDGKWYPLVTMDWVPGDTLFDWVRGKCLDQNRKALAKAAENWVEVIGELGGHRIAHGDLQHANVLVTGAGQLKLVDYDCMCVPDLLGRKNLEIGVDPYQHPSRDGDSLLTTDLDNFSALFIFVALRALAARPDLWRTYVETPGYDKLLFRREDIDAPTQSSLYQDLMRSPDAEVCDLTKQLVELARADLHQVPALHQILSSYGKVEQLLHAQHWDEAVTLLDRRGQWADAPDPMKPLIRQAQERVQCRRRLEQAVQDGNEEEMSRLCTDRLLHDYPAAATTVTLAKKAPQVIQVLRELGQAQTNQAWRAFVRICDANQALLTNRKSMQTALRKAQEWRERNGLCDSLERSLANPEDQLAALADAWQRLRDLGGHPEIEPRRREIELWTLRHQAWQGLRRVSAAVTKRTDLEFLAAWNETLFKSWTPAERERPRLGAARNRLDALKRLTECGAKAVFSVAGEQAVVAAAQPLPDGYEHGLEARVRQAAERVQLVGRLEEALREPVSDLKVGDLLQKLDGLQARGLVPPRCTDRLDLAEKRVPVLRKLQSLSPQSPPHELDPAILGVWKTDLLADCSDAEPWRSRYELAVRRRTVLNKIKKALEDGDDRAVAEGAADPSLNGYRLPPDWTASIQDARGRFGTARELLEALRRNDRSRFYQEFDAAILRRYASLFAPHQTLLQEWTQSEILPLQRLGLNLPRVYASLVSVPKNGRAYTVRWSFPPARFSDECLLAICSHRPEPREQPDPQRLVHRWPVDRKSFEDAGGSRKIHADPRWDGCYVVVWSIVQLGSQTYYSDPLILGRLGGG